MKQVEAKKSSSSQQQVVVKPPTTCKISSFVAENVDIEIKDENDSAKLLASSSRQLKLMNKMMRAAVDPNLQIGRRLSKSHRKWFLWAPTISLVVLMSFSGSAHGWPQLFMRSQGRQEMPMAMLPMMLADMPQPHFQPQPQPQILQPANLNQNLNINQAQAQPQPQPQPQPQLLSPTTASEAAQAAEEAQVIGKEVAPVVAAVNESKPIPEAQIKPVVLDSNLTAKLVDFAVDRVVNASKSGQVEKMASAAMQVLKPRKDVSSHQHQHQHRHHHPHKHVVSAEEQIISQHARLHLTGSHQRLLPTKQRDHRVSSMLMDRHQGGSQEQTALASIFGQLKSGITSRQSIVKAISDNKLARTLSTVGKSISGNKYVAGAAAASAVAALGLTVSKFLTPYLYADGYSKLADPMLPSSSLLQPIYHRNNAVDSLAYATSSSMLNPSYAMSPYSAQQTSSSEAYASLEPSASTAYADYHRLVPVTQKPSALYFRYRPSSFDTNGHYSDFYQQQSSDSSSSYSPSDTRYTDQILASASSQDTSLVSSAIPRQPPRRSGPVARIKLDEATRQRLYDLLVQQQQQQSQAYAVEIAQPKDHAASQPISKITRSAILQLAEPNSMISSSPSSSSIEQQAKWARPMVADSQLQLMQQQQPQQGQSVPKTIPPAAYLIIKQQKVADVFSPAAQQAAAGGESQAQSPQPPEALISSAGTNWRSLEPSRQQQQQQAWLVSGERTTAAPEDSSHKHHKQLATGEPAASKELVVLHRVSRTPPATVKAPVRYSPLAGHLATVHRQQQLDQYELRKSQYLEAAEAGQVQAAISADAKTNLIQLGLQEAGDNDSGGNKNSAIKLIEVHTNGNIHGTRKPSSSSSSLLEAPAKDSGKTQQQQHQTYVTDVMLPSRSGQQQAEEAQGTDESQANDEIQRQQQQDLNSGKPGEEPLRNPNPPRGFNGLNAGTIGD